MGHFQVQRSYMFNVYSQISKKIGFRKIMKNWPITFWIPCCMNIISKFNALGYRLKSDHTIL